MSEPSKFTAGTLVEWSRADDFAHGLWSFTYHLIGPNKLQIDTTADGGFITVALNTAQTQDWAAGRYNWFLIREVNGDRVKVDEGTLVVEASPFNAEDVTDTTTHAERVLAAIEKRIENRVVSDLENYTIDGRTINKIPIAELQTLRRRYMNEVRNEKIARGEIKPFKGNKVRLR